ncbi:MAG: bifunctional oligoribonuclease/PAP phosphatase NrnA [Rhodothermales bacterium]
MIEEILSLLLEKERFLITTHVRPDGDAIGSQLALGQFLRKLGKHVAMINSDPPPDNLGWLPGVDDIQVFDGSLAQHEHIGGADVILVVDTNVLDRVGKKMIGPVKNSGALKVLIDHHTEPETWFDKMLVRDTASSTGELIYELIAAHNLQWIDEIIATALYVAILTDTGSFRYSCVTPAVHRIVADLMERGPVRPEAVYAALYENRTPHWVRLLSQVLDTLTLRYDGQLCYVVVSRRMLEETEATTEDTEGFVSYGLAIEGVRVALIFTETQRGTKVSFRSKGDTVVHEWARAFGGGGHRNASGAFIKRPLDVVIDEVVKSAPPYLGFQGGDPEDNGTLSSEDAAYLSTLLDIKARK